MNLVKNENCFQKEKPNRIVIISDMIENGKKISHFQMLPKISDVKKD